MAQEFTNGAKDDMLDALSTVYVAAHDGSPGLTGANEISGGTYARILCSYNAASGGSKTLSSSATINIPSGNTITWLGIWDAASVGNFLGQVSIGSEAFGSDGTLEVTALTLALDQDPA
jgi:hypothetical protein